jgi:hypothetical protein
MLRQIQVGVSIPVPITSLLALPLPTHHHPPHLSIQSLASYRFHFSGMFMNGVKQCSPVRMLFPFLLTPVHPYPVSVGHSFLLLTAILWDGEAQFDLLGYCHVGAFTRTAAITICSFCVFVWLYLHCSETNSITGTYDSQKVSIISPDLSFKQKIFRIKYFKRSRKGRWRKKVLFFIVKL